MNKRINKFLLSGDKFMPELHLKHPGFTYSACGPFTKHGETVQNLRETSNIEIYCNSKDFAKRTISDKILKERANEIARNYEYDVYQGALSSMVYYFFDKKTGSGMSVNK